MDNNVDYRKPGVRIRAEQLHLWLAQAQLAEAINISDTYMGAIERGKRGLSLNTLALNTLA